MQLQRKENDKYEIKWMELEIIILNAIIRLRKTKTCSRADPSFLCMRVCPCVHTCMCVFVCACACTCVDRSQETRKGPRSMEKQL